METNYKLNDLFLSNEANIQLRRRDGDSELSGVSTRLGYESLVRFLRMAGPSPIDLHNSRRVVGLFTRDY